MAYEYCIIYLNDGSIANTNEVFQTTYKDAVSDLWESDMENNVNRIIKICEEEGTVRDVSEDAVIDYMKEHKNYYDGSCDGEKRNLPDFISKFIDYEDIERNERSDYEEHNTMNKAQQGVR